MFASLDKTKIPTGFLWDTSVDFIEREAYNGTALNDSNFVNLSVMNDMLKSINSASVGADTICVEAALSRIKRYSTSQDVMIGILFQPYNFIVSNALTDNLISYSNGIVSDVYQNGIWQNPYGEDVLVGVAMGKDEIVDQSVTFYFTNIDSLSTQSFHSILFDPGDGNGFRSIAMGGSMSVTYNKSGYVQTIIHITVGGKSYQTHSLLFIKPPIITPDALFAAPYNRIVEAEYNGLVYKAKLCFYDSLFHKRPLIVSEGFDPWQLATNERHSYSGFTDFFSFYDPHDSEKAFFQNYEIVYVDWYDYGADIRANAEVLKEVIRWVNGHNQSGESNIVIGQSMGGLIARYALRSMEIDDEESHNTSLFISHDVPYLGANVSPGLLFFYRDLYALTDNLFSFFLSLVFNYDREYQAVRYLGSCQSVKQMLPYYVDETRNYDNSVYLALQSLLDQMGFPVGEPQKPIENVAIINGGKTSFGSSSFYESGDKLLDIDIETTTSVLTEVLLSAFSVFSISHEFPFLWFPGKSTIKTTCSVWPYLTNNSLVAKTKVTFSKRFLWIANVDFTLYDELYYAPSSGNVLDAVPSSCYSINNLNAPTQIDTSNTTWLYSYSAHIHSMDSLMFIPVASAMVMPSPNDYSRDFILNKPEPRIETPFDSYVFHTSTSNHISFYSGVSTWLGKIINNHISGPDIVVTGDRFTISGSDSTAFTWSSSNPSIATIDSSGELTVLNCGVVDIIASLNMPSGIVSKRKTVLANMIQMVLDYSSTPSGYFVTADFVSPSVEQFIISSGLRDSLRFKWQLNTGGVVQTVIDTSRTFTAIIDSLASYASVTFSVLCHGHESAQSSVILRNPDKYSHNVISIRHNNNGTSYYCNNVHLGLVEPVPFRIWVEAPFGYQVPNPSALWKIKVMGKYFEGETAFVDNIPCVEFDLFDDDDVAGFITSVTQSTSPQTLYVYICDSDGIIEQVVQIPILWRSRL